MPNYQNGKIYKIIDNTNISLPYIGSTVQTLSNRLSSHRTNYKQYLKGRYNYSISFDIIKNNNYRIVLLENYSCNNKEELIMREQYYIDNINCINKKRAYSSKEYLKQNSKKWRINNKEKIKETNKQYNINNREKIKEKRKPYMKQYDKNRYEYIKTWGGNVKSSNNLLKIDVNLFL